MYSAQDFLFGLDNLRRLRGVIDLNRNVLCLDGASGREEVAFLGWVLAVVVSLACILCVCST